VGAFVVILLLALIAGELLLRLIAPGLLARLAYIPFKPARVVPLSRAATERLTQSGPVESDYRTAPERRIALTQLAGPNVLDTNGIRLIFGRGGGNVVAFRRLDAQKKVRPLVFVRLRAEGDRIVLSSRFVPSNILLLAAFFGFSSWNFVMTGPWSALLVVGFFLVLFFCIVLGLDWVAVGRLADAVEAEVASRVRLLTEGEPPPRAGDDAVVEEVEREPRLGLSTRDR
jgi:hypothetical protein